MPEVPRDPPPEFNRTTCACVHCVRCCKRQPGPLIPRDVERIRLHLQCSSDELKAKLWASPGALVRDTSTSRTHRIGTITPRWQKGRCVFLDTNDRCTIHRVAPFGCSHYDTHMPDSMANQRSAWALEQVLHSDDYQKLRAELPYATHYKPNEIE